MNKKPFVRKHLQRGLALVDVGIAIGIIAFMTIIGFSVVPPMLANSRANAEAGELPTVFGNIQKIYGTRASYTGLTLDGIIRLDAFPAERVTIPAAGAATAVNRWSGAITVAPANLTGTNDIARFVSRDIPSIECKAVLQSVAALTRRAYVDNANSGTAGAGTLVKPDGGQLDLAALGTACGTTNSITFDLGK